MDKIIYLIRHGNIVSNDLNIYAGKSQEGLSAKGIRQAEIIGEFLRELKNPIIYSSPIERTLQTSRIIAKFINCDIKIEPDLVEIGMGPWEGISEQEVAHRFPSDFLLWQTRPTSVKVRGRESLSSLQQRALQAVKGFLTDDFNSSAIFVTHVSTIRTLLLWFKGQSLDKYKSINVPNSSVYRIMFRDADFNASKVDYIINTVSI